MAQTEPCKECGGPARVAFHLDVMAAYAANLRECVRSGRMTYCGSVAPVVSGITDPREALRERLVYLERLAWNVAEARSVALNEPTGWRGRMLTALRDARMYEDRVAALIEGEPERG